MRPSIRYPVLAAVALTAACVIISSTTRVRAVDVVAGRTEVHAPARVHLRDGSIVLFRDGFVASSTLLVGIGTRYSPTLVPIGGVTEVALDSIVGVEAVQREVNPARTLLYTSTATAAGTVGTALLLVAIFGSCPTIYSDSAGTPRLEAESFSYSIAPLLEKRDVDRLVAQPDARGTVALELRNEALETHFIDHLELLETVHDSGEEVFPTPRGAPAALSAFVSGVSLRDRAGRDLGDVLASADERAFASDAAVVDAAARPGSTDHADWIDVTVPRPRGADGRGVDSVGLALRMRSSLLTTVLFYDYMLARPGARALDWQVSDLARITTLARVARWYTGEMGLQVSVRDGDRWRDVARLADFGPIAWRNVAVVVPAVAGADDSVHVRLRFLADEWRIDRVAVAARARRLTTRAVPVARVATGAGARRDDIRDMLAAPDERRLATEPGTRLRLEFDVGPGDGRPRTFLVAAQGFYTEWLRPGWIASPSDSVPFDPRRVPLDALLRTWRARRDSLESQFFHFRVPVA